MIHYFKKILKNALVLFINYRSVLVNGGFASYSIEVQHQYDFTSKTVLITGGTSGIGLSIAQRCLEVGANVIITGRCEKKLSNLRVGNPKLRTVLWDHSDIEATDEVVERICANYGEIDIVVNNAAIIAEADFFKVTQDIWDEVYSINSKAVFFICQSFCRRWVSNRKTSKYKKILNISSQGGFVGATYPYRLTKWDIVGLTEGLAQKFISDNIIVNAIAPGIVGTKMQTAVHSDGVNIYSNIVPSKRYGHVQEIASLALFLMSDQCNYIVGETIRIDGGFTLK